MTHHAVTAAELTNAVRNIPDFPKPGIQFKDITHVLGDARGFIFAAAAALKLKTAFVPVRKKGKLPYKCHEESYDLEYGSNTVAIHIDALAPGKKVILVDDLLA